MRNEKLDFQRYFRRLQNTANTLARTHVHLAQLLVSVPNLVQPLLAQAENGTHFILLLRTLPL